MKVRQTWRRLGARQAWWRARARQAWWRARARQAWWRAGARPTMGVAAVAVGAAALFIVGVGAGVSHGAGTPVSVFPIPGGKVAAPQTQLTFRGVPAGQIGSVTVTGSSSGVHGGRIEADSDGLGGSFLPAKPFTPGETVTVATHLNVLGATNGTYSFTVARPLRPVRTGTPFFAARVPHDARGFHSRPDLHPVAVTITKRGSGTEPGYIFLAPQAGPLQNGPMIVDSQGNLVWFKPLPRNDFDTDFRVQTYDGKPVLTWWQGGFNAGIGRGVDVIANDAYQTTDYVHAANGLDADLHEFVITRQNTALITAFYPVRWNATSVHGPANAIVFDCVVQEIDIPTGLVLFQWDSLDHVPLTDSYMPPPKDTHHPYNYFHVNSIQEDDDGNLIISARNTWAVYKVNHATGAVMWTLGGKRSSFKFGPAASFAFQHDPRVRAQHDAIITVFDDGAGPPDVHSSSRGLKLRLNFRTMTATVITQDMHSPPLLAQYEGNVEQLPNWSEFVGWGQQPYFSEFDVHGHLLFDGRMAGANSNYRAFRLRWRGFPQTHPALAVIPGRGYDTAYASWNGATEVKSWRIFGGSSPSTLRILATARRSNFETAIRVPTERYYAAHALDWHGHLMGSSTTMPPH
jgi:hypothetical protein